MFPVPGRLEAYPYGNDSVSLFWDDTGAVDAYCIYRGIGSGSPGALLAIVRERVYLDTGLVSGTTYFYHVAAVSITSRSPYSNLAWATPMDTPGITGISFHADIPAGTLEAEIEWTAACPGARYLVGVQSPRNEPEIGNTAHTSWTAVNPLPPEVTVYRYFVQPYVEPSEGILSYGPPSEPEEAAYPDIGPFAEPVRVRFEGTTPWEEPWHSGWLEDLIESYADSGGWPESPAPGSGSLAALARKLLKGSRLTENESMLKDLLHPDGLALLFAAYSAPPGRETADALSGLLNQIGSLLGRRAPKALGKEGQARYGRLLEHALTLLGADGGASPARTAEPAKTPHVNPTWTPTPWAVLITPAIIPFIPTPKPTTNHGKP